MGAEPLQDEELVRMIRNPDTMHRGFNLLVQQYQRVLYRLIARMVVSREDAEDLLQDTFIRIAHHIGNLKDPSNLVFWMMRIASNEALMFLRKKKVRSLITLSFRYHQPARHLEQYPALTGDEIQMKFQQAIQTLAPRQRIIFHLKYFEELKYQQIAKVMKITEGACKATYHTAMLKIEKYLTEE